MQQEAQQAQQEIRSDRQGKLIHGIVQSLTGIVQVIHAALNEVGTKVAERPYAHSSTGACRNLRAQCGTYTQGCKP